MSNLQAFDDSGLQAFIDTGLQARGLFECQDCIDIAPETLTLTVSGIGGADFEICSSCGPGGGSTFFDNCSRLNGVWILTKAGLSWAGTKGGAFGRIVCDSATGEAATWTILLFERFNGDPSSCQCAFINGCCVRQEGVALRCNADEVSGAGDFDDLSCDDSNHVVSLGSWVLTTP